MPLKLIMNENGTIAHKLGSLISGGIFTIISVSNTNVKIDSKGIFTEPLIFTFSGGNSAGFVPGSVQTTAPVSMNSTAQFVKADNVLVMREEDQCEMNCTGTLTGGGSSSVIGLVEISSAGQDKVKAE